MRCPFKEGEKIICIKENYYRTLTCNGNVSTNNFTLYDDAPVKYFLTPYKIYKIEFTPSELYVIINDYGKYTQPNWNHFITLKEYRKRKLIKLNNYGNQ